jgi:glutamate-1-semialdehyde 2,1-aminomutase
MYQAGTLSGNPLAMASGIATLETLLDLDWSTMVNKAQEWDAGFSKLAEEMEIPLVINRAGTMSGFYFLKSAPQNWQQVQTVDRELFKVFYHAMLDNSVFLAPSPFEASFYSSAHNADTNRLTLAACRTALEQVRLWSKSR